MSVCPQGPAAVGGRRRRGRRSVGTIRNRSGQRSRTSVAATGARPISTGTALPVMSDKAPSAARWTAAAARHGSANSRRTRRCFRKERARRPFSRWRLALDLFEPDPIGVVQRHGVPPPSGRHHRAHQFRLCSIPADHRLTIGPAVTRTGRRLGSLDMQPLQWLSPGSAKAGGPPCRTGTPAAERYGTHEVAPSPAPARIALTSGRGEPMPSAVAVSLRAPVSGQRHFSSSSPCSWRAPGSTGSQAPTW